MLEIAKSAWNLPNQAQNHAQMRQMKVEFAKSTAMSPNETPN